MKNTSFKSFTGISVSMKQFVAVSLLISGTLAWFFLMQDYYFEIFISPANEGYLGTVGLIIFYGFGALSAIIGSLISERVSRRKLLGYWIVISTLTTASLVVFNGVVFLLVVSIILGFCLGLGFPSCAALFADLTKIEERARVAGIIIFIAFVLSFVGASVIPVLGLGLPGGILFLTFLRSAGFLSLILDPCKKAKKIADQTTSFQQEQKIHFRKQNKTFISFLIPWVMFNIAAGLLGWWDISDSSAFIEVSAIGQQLSTVLLAISGLIGGSIADRYGRKNPVLFSLIMFGISFGLLSFTIIPESLFVYYATYGIAWGFLFTLYLTIPGDIATSGSKEKYYAIGTITPLIIYMVLSLLPELWPISIPVNLLSPTLMMILFLSILPVLRASETLTETERNRERFKKYAEKIGSELHPESKNSG